MFVKIIVTFFIFIPHLAPHATSFFLGIGQDVVAFLLGILGMANWMKGWLNHVAQDESVSKKLRGEGSVTACKDPSIVHCENFIICQVDSLHLLRKRRSCSRIWTWLGCLWWRMCWWICEIVTAMSGWRLPHLCMAMHVLHKTHTHHHASHHPFSFHHLIPTKSFALIIQPSHTHLLHHAPFTFIHLFLSLTTTSISYLHAHEPRVHDHLTSFHFQSLHTPHHTHLLTPHT